MSDNETVTEAYVFEYWDCNYCGHKGVRGDEEACASCGHPRDEGIRFYRKEASEEVVEDQSQVDRFAAGPDWVCSFCQALNSALDPGCKGCGASRGDSDKNYFDTVQARDSGAAEGSRPASTPKRSWGKILGIVVGIGVVLGALGYWAARSSEVSYEVAAVEWTRTIFIERYQWGTFTDWEGSLRGDGIERVSSSREVRTYKSKVTGTRTETYYETERTKSGTKKECKTTYKSTGSGASKKVTRCKDVPVYESHKVKRTREVPITTKIPVYDTKVTYRGKRYAPLPEVVARGHDNSPRWPEVSKGTGEDGKPDREGKRTATYKVTLKKIDSGEKGPDPVALKTSEQRFVSVYSLGAVVKIVVSNLGNLELTAGDEVVEK